MYNNEKVKEIQRVKKLSLEEMRARRLTLFTDFTSKRTTAITQSNDKRNEVVTLENDGKVEITRLNDNINNETNVDLNHKIDYNTKAVDGIMESNTNLTNSGKGIYNSFTEGHTVPLANKLGIYGVGDLLSKYNAKLKLPNHSIVFDYTQGISGYDIYENRIIKPEGYDIGLSCKGEGIFESNDGLLKGRLIKSLGLFCGGEYENLVPVGKWQCNYTGFYEIENYPDNFGFDAISIQAASYGREIRTQSTVIPFLANIDYFLEFKSNTIGDDVPRVRIAGSVTNILEVGIRTNGFSTWCRNIVVNTSQNARLLFWTYGLPKINKLSIIYPILTKTKSHRPFILPGYKVPDTEIEYKIYKDFKVLILKMGKIYPEYETINLIGNDKFIIQVNKNIASLFTREENNVFIFDKVNNKMYINGVEVSKKLYKYIEFNQYMLSYYNHTNYDESSGIWHDTKSNNHIKHFKQEVRCKRVADGIRFNDDLNRYMICNLNGSKYNEMTILLKVRRPNNNKDMTSRIVTILNSMTGADMASVQILSSTHAHDYDMRTYHENGHVFGYKVITHRPKDSWVNIAVTTIGYREYAIYVENTLVTNATIVADDNPVDKTILIGDRAGDSRYWNNYDISHIALYNKSLTCDEIVLETAKLEW